MASRRCRQPPLRTGNRNRLLPRTPLHRPDLHHRPEPLGTLDRHGTHRRPHPRRMGHFPLGLPPRETHRLPQDLRRHSPRPPGRNHSPRPQARKYPRHLRRHPENRRLRHRCPHRQRHPRRHPHQKRRTHRLPPMDGSRTGTLRLAERQHPLGYLFPRLHPLPAAHRPAPHQRKQQLQQRPRCCPVRRQTLPEIHLPLHPGRPLHHHRQMPLT